jgi:hypothetical protein
MKKQDVIIKNQSRPVAQDYEQLRQLGLQYIEQFSKDLWTDYNVHDPGITTLETLSYAITDLGYRTALPLEDILARVPGDTTKDFFTAREILPCNAVTFNDLRKKIIDVEGVENAWVLPYDDTPCAESKQNPAYHIECDLVQQKFRIHSESQTGFEPRNLHGLYQFNLLLEEDPILGDLNLLSVDWELRDKSPGGNNSRRALIRFIFPLAVEKKYPMKAGVVTDVERLAAMNITSYTAVFNAEKTKLTLTLNPGPGQVVIHNVVLHIQPGKAGLLMSDLRNEVKDFLMAPANQGFNIATIFKPFADKVARVSGIIDNVYCMYHRIRNLCEDVVRISIVPSQEIAVCTDIEASANADLEDLMGRVSFAIDTFFSPPVRFYLLSEMLARGYTTEFIFEGPLLRHGFIAEEDLLKSPLFSEIHLSDLYNLIMSVEGVLAVKYLQITNYLNGLPLTDGVPSMTHPSWTLQLGGLYHLNLDRLRSKITFFKGNLPITADKQVAARIYLDLKAAISKPRINAALKIPNDMEAPAGTAYDLEDYYSIQNEFPAVYGTGKDGIPSGSDIFRKTKIKQFKAYLLFFDQLLANYLSQLANIKNLYSVGSNTSRTYFVQPVYDAVTAVEAEHLDFYGSEALLNDFVLPAGKQVDQLEGYNVEWKMFISGNNGYRQKLNEFAEPYDETFDRQNRFLDHLLARFAENFSDYAARMYKFTGNLLESADKKTGAEIADDKSAFLKQYHILSYNRGKGQFVKCCPTGNCNQLPPQQVKPSVDEILEYDRLNIPMPGNATGLHKRTALMLGMDQHDNRPLVFNRFSANPAAGKFEFTVNLGDGHLLTSEKKYDTEKLAFEALERIISMIAAQNNGTATVAHFSVQPAGGGFRVEIRDFNDTVYAVSDNAFTSEQAHNALKKLKSFFNHEGMHIVEHLLLRPLPVMEEVFAIYNPETLPANDPKRNDFGFFPLCEDLNPDCDCPITDYYSFRISVVLPYWTERFRNMDFRAFAEDTMHRETPAHILPKYCWVSMYDMWRLESAYEDWFEENKKYKPNMNLLKDKLKKLITVLNTLTNVYPEGHLHDCANPGTDNPVILNQTILGTF